MKNHPEELDDNTSSPQNSLKLSKTSALKIEDLAWLTDEDRIFLQQYSGHHEPVIKIIQALKGIRPKKVGKKNTNNRQPGEYWPNHLQGRRPAIQSTLPNEFVIEANLTKEIARNPYILQLANQRLTTLFDRISTEYSRSCQIASANFSEYRALLKLFKLESEYQKTTESLIQKINKDPKHAHFRIMQSNNHPKPLSSAKKIC
jgi:hypothetical protein